MRKLNKEILMDILQNGAVVKPTFGYLASEAVKVFRDFINNTENASVSYVKKEMRTTVKIFIANVRQNRCLHKRLGSVYVREDTLPDDDVLASCGLYYKGLNAGEYSQDSGGICEYEHLKRMYGAAPENTVKPVSMVEDSFGFYSGYLMERIDGMDLLQIRRAPQLASGIKVDKADISQQITRTFFALHRKGIFHGDVKEDNIMLSKNGQVKLIDPLPFSAVGAGGLAEIEKEKVNGLCSRLLKNLP